MIETKLLGFFAEANKTAKSGKASLQTEEKTA
jgi:hypothetical protein